MRSSDEAALYMYLYNIIFNTKTVGGAEGRKATSMERVF
jgi:hypothetical protein